MPHPCLRGISSGLDAGLACERVDVDLFFRWPRHSHIRGTGIEILPGGVTEDREGNCAGAHGVAQATRRHRGRRFGLNRSLAQRLVRSPACRTDCNEARRERRTDIGKVAYEEL